MAVADKETQKPQHLGRGDRAIYWEWRQESPVEIVLVIFILVMFFMLPRTGCGIDKPQGRLPTAVESGGTNPSP